MRNYVCSSYDAYASEDRSEGRTNGAHIIGFSLHNPFAVAVHITYERVGESDARF